MDLSPDKKWIYVSGKDLSLTKYDFKSFKLVKKTKQGTVHFFVESDYSFQVHFDEGRPSWADLGARCDLQGFAMFRFRAKFTSQDKRPCYITL